jgi:hypothetical protein
MNNDFKYNADPEHAKKLFALEEKRLEAGVLGRFFGSTVWAAASIAWVVIFILTLSGVFVIFVSCSVQPLEYWKVIGPIITLAFGYLFGRSRE